jgi:hypothetical protein
MEQSKKRFSTNDLSERTLLFDWAGSLSLCEMPLVQKAVLQCLLHHPDLQVQKGKTYEIKNYL